MSLFTPSTDSLNDYYDRARYLLAWRVSLSFSIVFTVLSIIFSFAGSKALLLTSSVVVISSCSLIYLKRTSNHKPLFWVYAISGTILTHTAMNYVMEYTHYVDFLWMIAVVLVSFIGLGKKTGLIFLVLNTVGIACFFWFSLNDHIEILQIKSNLELTGDYIEVLLAMFVIAYLLYVYISFNDYSEMQLKEANNELAARNALITQASEENVVLIKEIHHRVKNNLQIITSLLRLQKGELEESQHAKFDEAINRIMTMSLIHQKLYQEKELSKVSLKSYMGELSNEVKSIYEKGKNATINIESDPKSIGLKTIVPFGLLLNELLSNSFKHAFAAVEKPRIEIKVLEEADNLFKLEYIDNGFWKEEGVSIPNFGTELIQLLTEQLEGTCVQNKSSYIITFNNLDI